MIDQKLSRIKSLQLRITSTSIQEAQFKLFYLIIAANVFKGAIYLFNTYDSQQGAGIGMAIQLMLSSILLLILVRLFPKYLKLGIFWAVSATLFHVYYRTFNENIGADTIALQAIAIVVISSFYGLNAKWGIFYTIIASAAPILCNYIGFRWTGLEVLPQGLNDLCIGINFCVILLSHLFFHGVLFGTLGIKERLNDDLREIAESKTTFLSTMAHELRTPLNSVIGLVNLVVEDNQNQSQKEHLKVLKFSADNLLSLVNDILDINKLGSGKLELDNVPFNCNILMSSVASSMAPQVKEKSIEFQLEVDPLVREVTYDGDATRLSQVLFNLIGNAVKFTDQGYVKVSLVLLDQSPAGDLIRFQIEDTGIGITASKQAVIFDPFMQASTNTTRKFGGTGLGLSIVKQLVEMFGSEVKLKSVPGKGTTIHFDLLLKRSVTSLQSKTKQTEPKVVQLDKMRILLAEDNQMNVYFMQQLLLRWNNNLDVAKNGQEALQMHSENHYDVILMDVNMPVMGGLEATGHIRSLLDPVKSKVHIIALTAEVSEEIKAKLHKQGINDFLPKPFQLEDLKSKLQDLAEKPQADLQDS